MFRRPTHIFSQLIDEGKKWEKYAQWWSKDSTQLLQTLQCETVGGLHVEQGNRRILVKMTSIAPFNWIFLLVRFIVLGGIWRVVEEYTSWKMGLTSSSSSGGYSRGRIPGSARMILIAWYSQQWHTCEPSKEHIEIVKDEKIVDWAQNTHYPWKREIIVIESII